MAYAIFRCCVTANHLPEFDESAEALLKKLGVKFVEIPEFGCCGYPLRNVDLTASLAASARNLALAEREGREILTSCVCCYGTLNQSKRLLEDQAVLAKVNESLGKEGLSYKGTAVVRHLFHVLKEDVEAGRLAKEYGAGQGPQNVAVQYGCKLLRPNMAAEFGPPNQEPFFESLVEAAGLSVVPWGLEKDCCGSSISTTDQALSEALSRQKMTAAQKAGADTVVAACPFCVIQLRKAGSGGESPEVLSVSQLLCQSLA